MRKSNQLRIFNPLFLNVYAEGTSTTNEPPQSTTPTINLEDFIARVRKEEKDKLYGEIQALKNKNNISTEQHNNLLLQVAEKDKKIEELTAESIKLKEQVKAEKTDTTNSATKDANIVEMQTTIAGLTTKLAEMNVSHQQEISRFKLEIFKKEKIAEAGNEIIPELIMGNTEEEIAASVELAKARYKEIAEKATKGITYSPPKTTGAMGSIQLGNLTMEEIRDKTPEEWKEFRKQLGLK